MQSWERVAKLRMLGAWEAFEGRPTAGTTRKLVPPGDLVTVRQVGLIRAYLRRKYSDETAFLRDLNKVLDTEYTEIVDVLKIHMAAMMRLLDIPEKKAGSRAPWR